MTVADHGAEQPQRAAYAVRAPDGGDLMEEIGTTGVVRYGGWIDDEFLPQLKGGRGRKTIREMVDNHSVIAAGLLTIDLMCRQVTWNVRPKVDQSTTGATSSSPQAEDAAELCRSALHDMEDSWPDTLSTILTMVPFGFAVNEEVYKYRQGMEVDPEVQATSHFNDSRLGWRNLATRAQETLLKWDIDDPTGRLQAFIQQAAPDYKMRPIPERKFLHFRTSANKGNPEGRSYLRPIYTDWYNQRRIKELEAIGIERDLAGMPVAWAPPRVLQQNPSAQDLQLRQHMEEAVRNVRRNQAEGLMWPLEFDQFGNKLYDFTLVTTGGRRQFDLDATVTRYDQRIAMGLLTGFILFGHEGTPGGLGVTIGSTMVDLFTASMDALLTQVGTEFNEKAFPRLLRYNGIAAELAPTLEHGQIEQVDLDTLGNYILHLAQSGAPLWTPGDDALLTKLMTLADLPVPTSAAGEI